MGLLEGQDGPEVRVIGERQILPPVVGAVVLAVGVDPGRDADPFLPRELNIVVVFFEVFGQLGGMGTQTVGWQVIPV